MMSDEQTETVVPIKKGATIQHGVSHLDVFVMDKACSVKLSDLFRKDQTTNKIEFKVVDDILDLTCLKEIRKEKGQERFFPEIIFVRKSLQYALERRLQRDNVPTVVFGSPGIGKSVFTFLAAIAMASTGRHKAVLYVRKVDDQNETATSLFWMTKTDNDDETVDIVACRAIDKDTSVISLCKAIAYVFFNNDINKSNDPTPNGIKIIVDGPRYEHKRERTGGSDLVTSGGCPPQSQQNRDEWHFPINVWSFDELFSALKSLKKCNRRTVEEIFDTTGGSVRLALDCCSESGRIDEEGLKKNQHWIGDVVKAQANDIVVKMAYFNSQLSADKNSLDRLRAMIVKEPPKVAGTTLFFEPTLVLASAYIARLLWLKLSMSEVHKAMIYAHSTGNRSLFGWHFELWGHKLSERAIDLWRQQAERVTTREWPEAAVGGASPPVAAEAAVGSTSALVAAGAAVGGGAPAPSAGVPSAAGSDVLWPDYIQSTGTGVEGIAELTAVWLYWKPSIPNFANIDSAILLGDGTLVCIQFTVSNEDGFDIRSFFHQFVFNIPEEVHSKIKKIKVILVVPREVTFSAVRVPLEQKGLFESHYSENPSQKSRPMIKFVKQKESKAATIPKKVVVPGTGNEQTDMMDASSEDSDVVFFDESLDGGWFSVDSSTMDVDIPSTLKVEFETRAVALNLDPGDSPFFDLPDLPSPSSKSEENQNC